MDLDHINYELNIQKSNLLLLKEYLNKMNNLIQEDDSYDNSFKFMEMLKELKINMDNTKANISNLTVLRTLLLNLQINSENDSNEKSNEKSDEKSDEEAKLDLAEDSNIEQTTDEEDDVIEFYSVNLDAESIDNSNIKSSEEKPEEENKKTEIKEDTSNNQDIKSNIEHNEELKIDSINNSSVGVPIDNIKEPKDDINQNQDAESVIEPNKEETLKFNEESNIDTLEDDIEDDFKKLSPDEKKSQEQIIADYYEECFEILEKNFVVFYAFLLNYINSCTLSEDYYLSELSKEKQYAIEFIQNELMEKDEEDEEDKKGKNGKETELKQEKHFTDERPIVDENPFMKNIDKVEIQEEVVITNKSNNKDNEDEKSVGTLIISEKDNKVILPYNEDDIKKILDETTEYTSLEQIIDDKYTIPLDRYKNPALSRFRETYNLMKKRQKASMADSLDLALELAFNSSLNPAIITACKNLEQLDSYLTCAELNEIDKFEYFKIKYEVSPMKK